MTKTQTTSAKVSQALVGRTARLVRSAAGRRERVRVSTVVELGGCDVVIVGDLLYSSSAYSDGDSRGSFSSLYYSLGDEVEVEVAARGGR